LAETSLVYSQGLGGRDEAQAAASNVPLSQQGASPTFSKLALDGRWTQLLPQGLQGVLVGQAQTSFGEPLFISEQFSLDGETAASGYPLGTFSVDEGATLRGELIRPIALPGSMSIAPYAFGAVGRGRIDDPTYIQQGLITAGSFGVGLRGGADVAGLPVQGVVYAVELARALSDVPGEQQGYRFNISIGVNF
ncbi:MAG: hypothetical protein JO255_03620, partial [Alphaproteobacteria bacterium]|nr:hypothetical protein [Hyphomicrobiales bacterium]MBV8650529.1 hypothetical protein [Alphaproteobacteria bacterium]